MQRDVTTTAPSSSIAFSNTCIETSLA